MLLPLAYPHHPPPYTHTLTPHFTRLPPQKDVQTAVAARRLLMSRAFSLLGHGGGIIRSDYDRVMAVLRPEHGPRLVDILWRVLDPHRSGLLGTYIHTRPEHGPRLVDILWRVLDPHRSGLLGTYIHTRPEHGPRLVDILWRVLDPHRSGLLGTSAVRGPSVVAGIVFGPVL